MIQLATPLFFISEQQKYLLYDKYFITVYKSCGYIDAVQMLAEQSMRQAVEEATRVSGGEEVHFSNGLFCNYLLL